jgi:hypothetical protein
MEEIMDIIIDTVRVADKQWRNGTREPGNNANGTAVLNSDGEGGTHVNWLRWRRRGRTNVECSHDDEKAYSRWLAEKRNTAVS